MPLSVDVVIPVHGHWELTEGVLASLAARDACIRKIIVVDDASPDDSAQRLRDRRDVHAVFLERNVGFAGACNAGARAGDADAILFLNNDTLVPSGAIERLSATLAESGAAAVGPKLLNGDGTLQVAGLVLLAGGTRFTSLYTHLDATLAAANEPYEPAALCGAALLIRRDAFDAVGGFDERFRNGAEDVDLCLSLWSSGYRCRYEPRAAIVHLEGATRGKDQTYEPNTLLLSGRWDGRLAGAPRWSEPLSPLIDLRWRARRPLERTVHRVFRAALRAYGGARVVDGAPFAAPVLAALDRRPRLTVEHRGSGAAPDVAMGAPETPDDARALRARGARRYWMPSARAAALLASAGVDPAAISVTRPGFPAHADAAPRRLERAAIVYRSATGAERLAPIVAALGDVAYDIIVADAATPANLARLRTADLAIFADEGDAWGVLATAALSAGAVTILPRTSVVHEVIDPAASIAVEENAAAIAAAARAAVADFRAVAARGPFAARDLARRGSDMHAARRMRELARAQVHGVADAAALSMPQHAVVAVPRA